MSKFKFGPTQATAALEINPVDANQVQQPYQAGSENYASSNEAVFTVVRDANNPKKATLNRVGAGLAQLTVRVDPNPDDSVEETLSKSIDIEVPAAEDTDIEIIIDGNVIA